jgi:two-component system, LuxR family, response regulator FixJ
MPDEGAVYVIDDDVAVRRSLAFLLATAGLTVRLFETAAAFLEAADGTMTGCVLTDVRMPGMDGIELLRRVRQKALALPVIVMTGHGDIPLAVQAMKEGAVDFIEKPFDDERLLHSVKSSLAQAPKLDFTASLDLQTLSERERQVLDGVLAGKQNKVIAHDRGLSPRTVEVYRANVMTKMNVDSLPELIRKALAAGAK